MATRCAHGEPADGGDAALLQTIDSRLERDGEMRLLDRRGEILPVPAAAFSLVHDLIHRLARGEAVVLAAAGEDLTTEEAADLLGISRTYLVEMLERDEIPYSKTGSHRRIRRRDLLIYKQRRDAARREGLRQITRLSQELGLYE